MNMTIYPVVCRAMLALIVMTLSACSSIQVRADADATVNIGNYHHYAWEPLLKEGAAGGAAFDNPLNEQRLKEAIDQQLAARKILPTPAEAKPDCYVRLAIGSRQAIDGDQRLPVRVGVGFGSWSPGFGSSVMISNDLRYLYREGRITVDLFDAVTRKPIWHVTVEQDLSYLTGNNAQQLINEVVQAMFAKFPSDSSSIK